MTGALAIRHRAPARVGLGAAEPSCDARRRPSLAEITEGLAGPVEHERGDPLAASWRFVGTRLPLLLDEPGQLARQRQYADSPFFECSERS